MQIDPAVARALAAVPSTLPADPGTIDIAALRAMAAAAARATLQQPSNDLDIADYSLSANGRRVAIRTYRPRGAARCPALLYLHGGGWMIGSIESSEAITAALATETNALVASVDYALAPEARHPAAIEDVEAAAQWLVLHAESLGIDPQRLCIAGDSAGGHLATLFGVRAQLAGRANPFVCQLLFYPAVDGACDTASYRENAHAPVLSAALMRWFIDNFTTPEQRADPTTFPLRATSLREQPEAYIVTAGHDPLRDEAAQYALRLVADGVPVTYRHAPDLVHGFLRLRGVAPRAATEFDLACAWLVRVFGTSRHPRRA